MNGFIIELIKTIRKGMDGDELAGDSVLQGLLNASAGAEIFTDSTQGWRALRGRRLNDVFECLRRSSTLPLFIILSLLLNALRYVNQFFDAYARSTRIRARAKGYEKRAPIYDLTNDRRSPIIASMQFLSCLLGCSASVTCDVYDLLVDVTRRASGDGSWSVTQTSDRLRCGAVHVSVAMDWRHNEKLRKFPHLLAVSNDPLQPPAVRHSVQRQVYDKPPCCNGFTVVDLRKNMTEDAIVDIGEWSSFWASALDSAFDSLDLSTRALEAVHAANQKLLVGSTGGGASYGNFAAKSTNRLFSSHFGTAVFRNGGGRDPGQARGKKRKASLLVPDGRGGITGIGLLRAEVCRENGLQICSADGINLGT